MNKNPIIIIFLTVFIDLVGFGIIIPLSPYLAREFGASALQVGLLMAIYSTFQFLMAPVWGQISDRVGRRPIILLSLFVAGISHIFFGIADSLTLLFLARALAGVGGANIATAMAYISDITETKDRSKGMGIIGAAFGLGFVFGPAVGGFFGQYGDSAPAFVAGGICLTNFVFALFFLPESRQRKPVGEQKRRRLAHALKHFRSPKVGLLMLLSLAITFSLANIEASLFLLVQDRFHWNMTHASFGFAFVGVIMAFTQGFLIRKLLPIFGERQLLRTGGLLFSLGILITGFSHSLSLTAFAMVLLALGNGLFNPSVLGLVSINSSQEEQGEVLGVMQSLSALSRITGPPIGGWLYQSFGSGMPFYFGSAIGFFAFVLSALSLKGVRQGKQNVEPVFDDDFQCIENFQLENIVNNAVPYRLFYLGETSDLQDHVGPVSLLRRVEVLTENTTAEQILAQVVDLNYPIILLSRDGTQAQRVARQLEALQFVNVYYLRSGIEGLNSANPS